MTRFKQFLLTFMAAFVMAVLTASPAHALGVGSPPFDVDGHYTCKVTFVVTKWNGERYWELSCRPNKYCPGDVIKMEIHKSADGTYVAQNVQLTPDPDCAWWKDEDLRRQTAATTVQNKARRENWQYGVADASAAPSAPSLGTTDPAWSNDSAWAAFLPPSRARYGVGVARFAEGNSGVVYKPDGTVRQHVMLRMEVPYTDGTARTLSIDWGDGVTAVQSFAPGTYYLHHQFAGAYVKPTPDATGCVEPPVMRKRQVTLSDTATNGGNHVSLVHYPGSLVPGQEDPLCQPRYGD